jgi:putative toxin-antitoxin system antitoxin component (TIGR02293 family)
MDAHLSYHEGSNEQSDRTMAIAATKPERPKQRGAAARGTASSSVGAPGAAFDTTRVFIRYYQLSGDALITEIKRGVQPRMVNALADSMAVPKERLYAHLRIPRSSISRKAREERSLSIDESARAIGLARLIGQVQSMVEESGHREPFDAAKWTAEWLETPLPALGGRAPAEYMDTDAGQAIVSNLLARMVSGAYA